MRGGAKPYIVSLPLLPSVTVLVVVLLSHEVLYTQNVHVDCFLHHLDRLVACVLKVGQLRALDEMSGITNELIPQAPLRGC